MKRIVVTDVQPTLGDCAYIRMPAGKIVGCYPGRGTHPTLQVWQEVETEQDSGLPPYVPWMLWVLRAKAAAPVLPLTEEWAWSGVEEFWHQPAAIYLRPQRVGVDP